MLKIKQTKGVKAAVAVLLTTLLVLLMIPISSVSADSDTLSVTIGSTADELANCLVGEGIEVSNAQLHAGIPEAAGTFTGGIDVVGFDLGIILSNGDASDVVGTYLDDNCDTTTSGGNDADLDSLGIGTSNDTCFAF